jgi:hypothetical protein
MKFNILKKAGQYNERLGAVVAFLAVCKVTSHVYYVLNNEPKRLHAVIC